MKLLMMLPLALCVAVFGQGCKTAQSTVANSGSVAAASAGSTSKKAAASGARANANAASKPSLLGTGLQAAPALLKLLGGGDAKAKASAKQQLLGMGVKVIPQLLGALRGKSASTQKGALDVLGSMGKKASSAKDDVQKLTKSKDASVRKAAADTLKKIQ